MTSENQPDAPVETVEAVETPAADETPDREARLEAEMAEYPLREAGEDPKWAVRTVWVWICIVLFGLVGIVALLLLGAFYD